MNYTLTETTKEHRSSAFASSKQTLKESSVQFELLQESAEATTVKKLLPRAQQANLVLVTTFYADNILLEEGNKCFELDNRFGLVNEQQFALQDNWNEEAMYQKQCHVAMKDSKLVKCNAKSETQAMEVPFVKKTDYDFKVNLVEETIPSHRNVWNPWISNGNSGMDAVSQANGSDKIQLSKGHRKQQTKRT